jgi:hypothetical protein
MQITGEIFAFPFKQANWKGTAALGGLIALVGIAVFPLMYLLNGFGVRVMRQTMRGEAPSLPAWDDWSQIIKDTLWYVAVMIVWLLPVGLIIGTIWASMYLALFAMPGMAISSPGPMSPQAEQALFTTTLIIIVVMAAAMIVAMALSLPLQFFAYVALTRAVAHQSLMRAFEVRQVWQLAREGIGGFIAAFVLAYAVQMGTAFISALLAYTIILYCFYPIFLGLGMMYSSLLMCALFGQAYREAQGRMAAAGVIA